MRKTILLLASAALALLLASGVAFAAFPGSNGKIAFVSDRDGNANVYVMDADGSNQEPLTDSPADDTEPAWSPDGRRIAFTSDRTGREQLYVMSQNGTGVKRITRDGGSAPSWAPNGRRIVFELKDDLWVLNLRDRAVRRIEIPRSIEFMPAWSPDGKRIAFSQRNGPVDPNSNGIFTMTPRGQNVRKVTPHNYHVFANWSPDGRKIAASYFANGYTSIVTVNSNGTGQKTLVSGSDDNDVRPQFYFCSNPAYSPDGETIVFSVDAEQLWAMNTRGGERRLLTPEGGGAPDWQPLP